MRWTTLTILTITTGLLWMTSLTLAAENLRPLSIPRSNENGITIGSAVDVDLINQQRSACLDFKPSDITWLDGGGAIHTNATIELVTNYDSLAKTLALEVDYKSKADVQFAVLAAGGSANLNVKYDTFAKDESRTLAIVIKAFSDYGRRGLTNYPLNVGSRQLIDAARYADFRERCGTHTVIAQHNEAMVAVVFQISVSSTASKSAVEAAYSSAFHGSGTINAVGISGNVETRTHWKNVVETSQRLGKLDISFESVGGAGISDALKIAVSADPENLGAILTALTSLGSSFTADTSAPVQYLLVENSIFGVPTTVADTSKLDTLNAYYLQLSRIDYALSRVDKYKTSFPELTTLYASLPEMAKLRVARTQLVNAIETCVLHDQCTYKIQSDLGLLFAEDIISPTSVKLTCTYTRYDSTDGGVKVNVLTNAAVVVRGSARLTDFVSVPTAIVTRLGPDSTPPRTMVSTWQSLSLSGKDAKGSVKLIGQIDNQIFRPDVEIGTGNVVIKNESTMEATRQDMLNSIYALNMQGNNGFFVQNAVGPPFGGDCPLKKDV